MWTRRTTALAAALLAASCADPAPESDAESPAMSDEEAVAAVADYWETHFNLQHPEMVASKYTEDAWTAPADGGWIEGREEIQAWLAEMSADAATADITPVETVILGDKALSMGRYTVSTAGPDGNPMELSGAYMNALDKIDGEWRIVGSMTNYDSPRPDGWEWRSMPAGDAPPDVENQFSGLVEAFASAWNAQDPAGVAALYAEDAMTAYTGGTILEGRAAIEADVAERMQPGVSLELHQVDADQIDETHWGSGGWYAVQGPDGSTVQTGMWWNIYEVRGDEAPKIVWTFTNAFPMEM
jgi:uncharacterized protein (TIGR02246 family)